MNLNKCIKILLTKLSQKYDVSLIEIHSVRNGEIKKIYKIILDPADKEQKIIKESFYSKKQLVSWLLCQK